MDDDDDDDDDDCVVMMIVLQSNTNRVESEMVVSKKFFNFILSLFGIYEEVCYKEYGIGCFKNKPPFDNAAGFLPNSPNDIQVRFFLYTRNTPTTAELVTLNNIGNTAYNGGKLTKFIIHGYQDKCNVDWVRDMTGALLAKGDFNVFCVDWQNGADEFIYKQTAANTRVVGALLAQLIARLKQDTGAKYSDMHLIGHSLGAHIAGYAGKKEKTLGRISGLDPAGPCFGGQVAEVRLARGDAAFIDAIHTDGENLLEWGFGLFEAVGNADFYPNGGQDQPGCSKSLRQHFKSIFSGSYEEFVDGIACDHMRATKLFTESISTTCSFRSYPCDDNDVIKNKGCSQCNGRCSSLGYNADQNQANQKYFLKTHTNPPYCKA